MINPDLSHNSPEQEKHDISWMQEAACKDVDTSIFFDGPFDLAVKFCVSACTVKQECYDYAVSNKEERGVWGGVIFRTNKKKKIT